VASDARLRIVLDALDRTGGAMRSAENRLNKLGRGARNLGRNLSMKVSLPLALVGGLALKTFASFEKSIVRAGALANATGEDLKSLEETARKMGRETIFSATQAADALAFLSMAGFSVRESTRALPGVLELAAAAQLDLATAADITSNVLTGYGLKVEELGRVNDVLTKAFTSANTDLRQLGEAMKLAGPTASAAGVGFEEAAAALALMGNAGIQASMAGTSLRGAITRLLNPVGKAKDTLAELGVTVLDASGGMVPFVDIVAQLEKSGITAGQAMQVFGQRAGPAMLALISQGSEALREMTTELENSGGIAANIAAKQMDTFAGTMAELKSVLEDAAIELGTVMAPALRNFVDTGLKPAIMRMSELIARFQDLPGPAQKAVLAIGALAITAGPAIFAVGLLAPGIVGVTKAVRGLTSAMAVLMPFLVANPFGLLLVGIGALVAMIVVAQQATGKWHGLLILLKSGFMAMGEGVVSVFRVIQKAILGTFQNVVNFVVTQLNTLRTLFNLFGAGIPELGKLSMDILETGDSAMRTGQELNHLIDEMRSGSTAADVMDEAVSKFMETVGDTGDVTDEMVRNLEELKRATDDLFSSQSDAAVSTGKLAQGLFTASDAALLFLESFSGQRATRRFEQEADDVQEVVFSYLDAQRALAGLAATTRIHGEAMAANEDQREKAITDLQKLTNVLNHAKASTLDLTNETLRMSAAFAAAFPDTATQGRVVGATSFPQATLPRFGRSDLMQQAAIEGISLAELIDKLINVNRLPPELLAGILEERPINIILTLDGKVIGEYLGRDAETEEQVRSS
jgi:TP901 family phage tail tape measure protein